jgi:hypothetical protein
MVTWYWMSARRFLILLSDGIEGSDGRCYIIYDRERSQAKEILMAVFTEVDVEAGKPISKLCRLKQIVNRVPT